MKYLKLFLPNGISSDTSILSMFTSYIEIGLLQLANFWFSISVLPKATIFFTNFIFHNNLSLRCALIVGSQGQKYFYNHFRTQ